MKFQQLIENYLQHFPEEADLLSLAKEQASKENETKLTDRKNFVGHFTASAFIVSKDTKKVLLLEHKVLGKMLQPGGHIDKGETPLQAAYRELEEEAAIKPGGVEYRAIRPGISLLPFDIDSHFIPENQKKAEDSHYHHDLRYAFVIKDEQEVIIDKSESKNFKWTDWKTFAGQPDFSKVAKKLEELIYERLHTPY